jgi:signal transduction histidine kinase/CheY-like chemotaxis protein
MSGQTLPLAPVRQRVALLWVATAVLVLTSIGLATRQEAAHRADALRQAEAQTDVLAGSVSAALAFNDTDAMRQSLQALMRDPRVVQAAIYGPDGARRAQLSRPGVGAAPDRLTAAEALPTDRGDVVARPVIEQGQQLGFVYLQTTPESLASLVGRHTSLIVLTLLSLLLLAVVTQAAARLADANARLSEEIEARAAAEDALRQAQKLEALGQLTGGIAHDFNNLLQAIHGAFELILGKAGDERTVRRWATNGIDAANRGARLTRQLLAFSRQQKLELKPLIVADTLAGMADLIGRTLGPSIELVFDLDEDRLLVMSDPTQLELALMNLAVNARDAMLEGGRLIIRTRKVDHPGDAVLPAGRYIELQVVDSGEGMAPAVAERAFEPFFTTKTVGRGTGLGLAQVYGVARQAGGDARIVSQPGQGTSVIMLLSEASAAALAAAPKAPTAALSPSEAPAATVLLVDDDDAVRATVSAGLEARGFRVLNANGGEAGLALADAGPDIAVIDYAMPGMDGAATAEALRSRLPNLPIILASGHSDTAAVERVLGGAATIMRKPFDTAALADAITRVLRPDAA